VWTGDKKKKGGSRDERGKRKEITAEHSFPPRPETISENLEFKVAALSPPVR
jgi:hypothetical protein